MAMGAKQEAKRLFVDLGAGIVFNTAEGDRRIKAVRSYKHLGGQASLADSTQAEIAHRGQSTLVALASRDTILCGGGVGPILKGQLASALL
eukprot:3453217-Alexandrium_andersonii.AAC.1